MLTHLSLFSGIGGLDLAAETAGFITVGQCEWADYPTKVLEKHWPDVPRWRDIRTLTKESFYERTGLRTVDVISGGFPCQPFSVAGKQRGKEDDRYLWPEMLRVIKEIRPTWIIGENVPGIIKLALDTVLSDLEGLGYACQTFNIPACGVDAPHKRARICIVGYAKRDGSPATEIRREHVENGGDHAQGQNETEQPARAGGRDGNAALADASSAGLQGCEQHGAFDARRRWAKPYGAACKLGEDVADSDEYGRSKSGSQLKKRRDANKKFAFIAESLHVSDSETSKCKLSFKHFDPARVSGFADDGWWATEPNVGRVAHGVPARVDRLKCLGNAVVPQQFYPFFAAIAEITAHEKAMTEQWGGGEK